MEKRIRSLLFLLFVSCCVAVTTLPSNAAAQKYINFGGGGPGGGWFYITGGIAPILTRDIEGLNVVSEATQGDIENARRLAKGELDMTMNHSSTLKNLFTAAGAFKDKEPAKQVRLIAKVYESPVSICTLKTSGIKTLSDMVGKRIAMGPPGSGTGTNAKRLFGSLGLWDKIKPRYMSFADGATALIEGHVDVLMQNGAPIANVISVEAVRPIRLIGLTEGEGRIYKQKYPGYMIKDIPPKTYESIDYPVRSFWSVVFFDTTDKMEENWIYRIVKVIFEEKEKGTLKKIHVLLKQLAPGLEEGKDLGIPFHPGAIKYYKEKGLL